MAVFWKRASGGEDDTTFSTGVAAEKSVTRTWRITGAHTSTNPAIGTTAVATNTNPDPPSLDPADWGAEDTLWLAVVAAANGGTTITTYPTNYTNGITENSGGTSDGVAIATARRELNATSEDPSTFTMDASRAWRANTIAVRPASATSRVTSDADLRWKIAALVSKDADLRWKVAALVNKDADLRWKVASLVSKDADLRWRVASVVGKDADLRWSILAAVAKDADLMWRVEIESDSQVSTLLPDGVAAQSGYSNATTANISNLHGDPDISGGTGFTAS
jgi:hypothetical protein